MIQSPYGLLAIPRPPKTPLPLSARDAELGQPFGVGGEVARERFGETNWSEISEERD